MHIIARDMLWRDSIWINPRNAALPPFVPLFSQVPSPPVDKQEATPVPEETRQANVVMRPCGKAQPFPQIGPTQYPIHMPRVPIWPVSLPAGAVALIQSPAPPWGLMAVVAHLNTPEPPQPDPKHLMDMMVIGAMAPRVSHMHASRVVRGWLYRIRLSQYHHCFYREDGDRWTQYWRCRPQVPLLRWWLGGSKNSALQPAQ